MPALGREQEGRKYRADCNWSMNSFGAVGEGEEEIFGWFGLDQVGKDNT